MDNYLNDIEKYMDVGSILEKLKMNENFTKLENNLISIFKEESAFAYNEISRIAKQDSDINVNEQFKLNNKIFKSNLKLIINSMINSIWKNGRKEIVNNNSEIEFSNKNLKNKIKKKNKSKNKNKTQNNFLKDSRASSNTKNYMKNTFSASQKLNGSFNNEYYRNTNEMIDFNESKISCYSRIDNSQLNKIKKLIGEKDDLDSEFLYEKKGVRFSKDNKDFNWNNKVFKNELIPGPNQYDPNNCLKKLDSTKGSAKFGKQQKRFWMDEQSKTYTPGPIYNPKKNMISN